jgi:hypothetical protein
MRPSDEELAARFNTTPERVREVLAEMRRDWDALDAADYSDEAMEAFARTRTARALGEATAPKISPERVSALCEELRRIRSRE